MLDTYTDESKEQTENPYIFLKPFALTSNLPFKANTYALQCSVELYFAKELFHT